MSQTDPSKVVLPRTTKGKRPSFFADPTIDQMMTFIVELTTEVGVMRERLDTVERLLELAHRGWAEIERAAGEWESWPDDMRVDFAMDSLEMVDYVSMLEAARDGGELDEIQLISLECLMVTVDLVRPKLLALVGS